MRSYCNTGRGDYWTSLLIGYQDKLAAAFTFLDRVPGHVSLMSSILLFIRRLFATGPAAGLCRAGGENKIFDGSHESVGSARVVTMAKEKIARSERARSCSNNASQQSAIVGRTQ